METYFSKNAKKLLKDKDLTQSEFCEKLGFKKSNWENIVKTNNIETLFKIAEVLEMTLEDVIGLKRQKFSICGFVKVNETLYEISSKTDLLNCMDEVSKLDGSE
jgi:transcriptional regulator with XRE-family HTH domain